MQKGYTGSTLSDPHGEHRGSPHRLQLTHPILHQLMHPPRYNNHCTMSHHTTLGGLTLSRTHHNPREDHAHIPLRLATHSPQRGDGDVRLPQTQDQELFHHDKTSTTHNFTTWETARATTSCLAQECSLAVTGSMTPRPGLGAAPPPVCQGSETEGLREGRTRIGAVWRRRRVHRSELLAKHRP